MRKIAVLTLLVLFGLTGCKASVKVGNVSGDEASIKSIETAKGFENNKAVNPASTFPPNVGKIYAVVKVSNPTDKPVTVRAEWIAVDAGGEKDTKIIDSSKKIRAGGEGTIGFSFSLPNDFPTGTYRVDVFLDDTKETSATFAVA